MKCIPLHVLLPPHLLRFAHFFTPLVYQMHCKRKTPPVVRAAKLQRRWKKGAGVYQVSAVHQRNVTV